MKKKLPLAGLVLLLGMVACQNRFSEPVIDLAGKWAFRLDPKSVGDAEKWYIQSMSDSIYLPGSLAENGIGEDISTSTIWTGQIVDSSYFKLPRYEKYRQPGNVKVPFWLQPEKYYTGQAWFQKSIEIPDSWEGKRFELLLERCHWESRVWVDNQFAGMQNALGTAHCYNLTSLLKPGKHVITICIDNRIKEINVGQNSHSISDHTQSNWNGIVGRMELKALSPVRIADIQIYPDIEKREVFIRVEAENPTLKLAQGSLDIRVIPENFKGYTKVTLSQSVALKNGTNLIELVCPMGDDVAFWDEFSPNLYRMTAELKTDGSHDLQTECFGMRKFSTQGTRLTINNRPTFMRGTLECAIFPETGYPPTDTASWMRIYRIARAYGLNQLRFHSWCPPKAAFEAADRTGFYLQVECGSWANQGSSIGDGAPLDQFIYDEGDRILKAYGNHPSFCMFLYGNEPAGNNQQAWLGKLIQYWRSKDNRRIYTSGAGWPVIPESDYNSISEPRIQRWGEGLNSIINAQPPRSDYDWRDQIENVGKPTVSHEIGQWCVYPDFKEIARYTGVLKARNFEIFKEQLIDNGMAQLADSFLLASGKLQALCYKADIEAALRTPGFGGFQLLDLHDFPGQGTALVGVLNPFWEEKGYISAAEYNRFCNATVPLARLPKMIFSGGETLKVPVEIAHFGEQELKNITPKWKLTDSSGKIITEGKLAETTIPLGNGCSLGEINQPLPDVSEAKQLKLVVSVAQFANDWDIWLYPATQPEVRGNIFVTQKFDAASLKVLNNGGSVLLTPGKGSIKPAKGGDVAVGFSSIFWNTAWTMGQPPHTLGILCNPEHPALADFPTEYHSNYQWWDAMSHSNAILLSSLSPELKPIVRIIDDWVTNRPLGLIVEGRIGKGKIIITGIDLLKDIDKRPEAQQLLFSLKKYMNSSQFKPITLLTEEQIGSLFQ